MFAFATCDRKTALEFLKKLRPDLIIEDTKESVSDLLDLVQADEIRITDPDFHTGQIIQSKNWNEDSYAKTQKALEKAGLASTKQ